VDTATVAANQAEPGLTLADKQPRTMRTLDQIALWGNLGFSLLGPVGALYVLYPATGTPLPLAGAFLAVIVGTLIGTVLLAVANVAGARSGKPAMVLLRGVFGTRLSYLPTVLNLVQLLGWAMFELLVISAALQQLLPWDVRWPYVLAAGVLTTLMALYPLGSVRLLRRYALIAVLIALVYLVVQLAAKPVASPAGADWSGFWVGADVVIALAVSWIPLAADYSRHARSERSAFGGSLIGFAATQIACYGLGLLAFSTVVATDGDAQHDMFGAFIAVPLGALAFAVLVARELDESFTNVYSTAVSVQNLRPLADRRILAVAVGAVVTVGALTLEIADYQNFLYLIGSVFVPMFAVFAVRYFLLGGHRHWRTGQDAPDRWLMLLPWLLGFASYQVVNPGLIGWWSQFWFDVRDWLHFAPPSWLSASLTSLVVAGLVTYAVSRWSTPVAQSTEPVAA
jgi:putative hydroxymethylpyrimidine transporter CytX